MPAAIRIGVYFAEHARAALARMGKASTCRMRNKIAKWILRMKLTSLTKRDAHHDLMSRFKKADHLDPALAILEQLNYIRDTNPKPKKGQKQDGPGRPGSPVYEVNPLLTETTELTKCQYGPISVDCVNSVGGNDEAERKSYTPARVAPDNEEMVGNVR
jgi:hypothetical protein